MVNSKKMSKSSIAVICLAILLVLSMILGITGAWFTDTMTEPATTASMKFGNVDYEISANGTTVKNGEAEAEKAANGTYLLVAGTKVTTGITILNKSDVETYYVLANDDASKFYVLDTTNKVLVDVTDTDGTKFNAAVTGTGNFGKVLANASIPAVSVTYQLTISKNYGDDSIWTITGDAILPAGATTSIPAASVQRTDASMNVDLGLALFNATYQVRAIQSKNL